MNSKNIIQVILFISLTELVGAIGSIVTAAAISEWYLYLEKPFLNPPAWVFGPVWTVLYALMGIAAFIVWKKGLEKRAVRIALGAFALQLLLNGLWSFLFFGLRNPGLALLDIVALWVAIALTIILFLRISRIAGYLLVPYILWVSFAWYLNVAIWFSN